MDDRLDGFDQRIRKLEQRKIASADLPWMPMQARMRDELLLPGGITSEMVTLPEEPQAPGVTLGAPPLLNTWTPYDSTTWRLELFKHMGIVYVSGLLAQLTSANEALAAFTLPVGYRPRYWHMHPCPAFYSVGGYAVVRCDVATNGSVYPKASLMSGTASGTLNWVSLDFCYRAA